MRYIGLIAITVLIVLFTLPILVAAGRRLAREAKRVWRGDDEEGGEVERGEQQED